MQKNNIQKNDLLKSGNTIIRILDMKEDLVFVIDCIKRTMPKWVEKHSLDRFVSCTVQDLHDITGIILPDIARLDAKSRKCTHEHFTLIASILPFAADEKQRTMMIDRLAELYGVSKQTVRYYLCLYLVYQDISVLAPKQSVKETVLSADEKNMRWALNKFFYTHSKNTLKTAYTMMLKTKYCDSADVLLPDYPSFYQFRYFYRKHRKMQTYYISRDGLKRYQRDKRPLLGDGIQEFAPYVGVGMLDATVCDIYLVNESGSLVGRPILTVCIDAYSSLCCGYSLSWEGGTYSLRGLMVNILSDKVQHCKNSASILKKLNGT